MRIPPLAALLPIALAISCAANRGPAVPIDGRVNDEIHRVDLSLQKLAGSKLPEGLQGLLQAHQAAFAKTTHAQSPALRLYRLRDPYFGAATLEVLTTQKAAGEDFAALEKLWKSRQHSFEQASPEMKGPALLVALREAAGNRAQKLFRASLPYGKTASPGSGLYYLAEAEGNLRFKGFIESLLAGQEAEGGQTVRADTLAAALETLESKTLKAFEDDPVVPATIPVSARLKETRELLEQKQLDGATLTLLESQLEYDRQTKRVSPAPANASTVEANNSSEGEPQTARIITNDVQPLYASLFVPGAVAVNHKQAPVTVTLVRWPYT